MPKAVKYDKGYKVNFRFRNKRYQRRFRWADYDDPKKAALDFIDLVKTGQVGESMALTAAVRQYAAWRYNKFKRSTVDRDQSRLKRFLTWCADNKVVGMEDINLIKFREFHDYFYMNYPFLKSNKRKCEKANVTWNKYRLVLSNFFEFCSDRRWMDDNFARHKEFKVTIDDADERWFTPTEVDQIIKHFDTTGDIMRQTFYRFLPYTGFRVGEALNLKWRDINFETQIITARNTKVKRNRSVPMHNNLRGALEKIQLNKPSHLVFAKADGHPYYTGPTWYHVLVKATNTLGMEQGNLKAFRHAFGSALASNGTSVREIMELMGHTTPGMALRYIHASQLHLREKVNQLPFGR